MTFDYFSYIRATHFDGKEEKDAAIMSLASGFSDYCAVGGADERTGADESTRNKARSFYMDKTRDLKLTLPEELQIASLPMPLLPAWFALEVAFSLQTPWYSKDDRPFHILENPVRKDRVFGAPFMSAASWKGLLRWACRMEEGLLEHLETHQGNLDEWCDPDWITHFFGNERDEDEDFCRGALQFFPTWFDKIDFEVINPHDRSTRAGTHPIYYEVVPADTRGTLSLLYAPFPGQADLDSVKLLNAIEKLLTVYGFSAKRTAGWGIATVDGWTIKFKDLASVSGDCAVIKTALDEWRQSLKDKK